MLDCWRSVRYPFAILIASNVFMEPVATILFAALLFGERMTIIQWGAVALVALGLMLFEVFPGHARIKESN